jgi:hypothetical protein
VVELPFAADCVRAWRSHEPCSHSLLVTETVWCIWLSTLGSAPVGEAAAWDPSTGGWVGRAGVGYMQIGVM